jgi:hypothetical protein
MTRCAKATGAGITASHLLMELLAIPLMRLLAITLSNQNTVAKWLVISQQAGKWLVIPQTAGCAITSDLASVVCSPSRMASSYISNVPARGRPMGSPLLRSDPFALSEVRPQHGGAEPSGAGVAASHLLPQSAGFASNVSEVLP